MSLRMRYNARYNVAPLTVLILVFLILGVTYSLVTPIFEASDEFLHYPVVKYIADGKGLPVQDPAVETLWRQEGSQPPLYYAVAALVTSWIDTDDMKTLLWHNPHVNIGNPLEPGNKNLVVHTAREEFPWRGTALAVHLIRFLSVLMQAVTVLLTYLLAAEVAPGRRALALAAAAVVAFNPMFLFIAASVNNDNLVVPLAAFVLWRLAAIWRRGWPKRWEITVLGLALGLAALTKLSGLTLSALAAGVLTVLAARRRAWRAWVGWGVTLAAFVAVIAGWWYVRNWQLYGDPTGLNFMLDIAGRRPDKFGLRDLLGEFEGFRMSYWGVFGGFNIIAWRWVYWLYDGLIVAALGGWAWRLVRGWRRDERPNAGVMLILAAWVLLVGVALIRWTSQTYASQGRLLFPAIAAVAILTVLGWAGWLPDRRRQERGLVIVVAISAALAAVMPFAIIAPAYARPAILTADQVPESAVRVDWVYGGQMRLLAYELPQSTVSPGQRLPLVVYWSAAGPIEENWSVYVHLLGRNGAPVGQIGTYPGNGAYPTSQLHPGEVIRDQYWVPVAGDADVPSLLRVDVGLYLYGAAEEVGLPAVAAADRPADGPLGAVRLLPRVPPNFEISQPARFDLGGQAAMLGYDLTPAALRSGETVTLTLYWQAQERLTEDFQVFAHLTGSDGVTVAQADKAPLDGNWPTSAWEPGQTFADTYVFQLPSALSAGDYVIRAGLYRLADGWRLPVQGPAGRVADAAMIVTEVRLP